MGSHPYMYFADWMPDPEAALQALRRTEWQAGRYDPVMHQRTGTYMFQFGFPPTAASPAPGSPHATFDEALDAIDAGGSGGILDIQGAIGPDGQTAHADLAAMGGLFLARVLGPVELQDVFGTASTTRQHMDWFITGKGPGADIGGAVDEVWEGLDRGQAVMVPFYAGTEPAGWFVAGMSVD